MNIRRFSDGKAPARVPISEAIHKPSESRWKGRNAAHSASREARWRAWRAVGSGHSPQVWPKSRPNTQPTVRCMDKENCLHNCNLTQVYRIINPAFPDFTFNAMRVLNRNNENKLIFMVQHKVQSLLDKYECKTIFRCQVASVRRSCTILLSQHKNWLPWFGHL